MCGIVGVLSNGPNKNSWTDRRNWFNQALFCDTLRGYHSTGLMCLDDRDDTVYTFRKPQPAYDVLDMKSYDKVVKDMDHYRFMIGHNRAATRGKVNVDNSHPFHHGSIVGVHNGTINNVGTFPDGHKFAVDSQAIFNAINENGAEDVIPKISGAFALVWCDLEDKQVHIVRNKERPLHYAVAKDEQNILIASEEKMIDWLADRNNITINEILPFEEGVEYIFEMGDVLNFQKVTHELKKPAATPIYGQGQGSGYRVQDTRGQGGNEARRKRKGDNLLELSGYKKGDAVDIIPYEFYPYSHKNTDRGRVIGLSTDGHVPNVIIHNISRHLFDTILNTYVVGSVMGMCYETDYLSVDPNNSARVETLLIDGQTVTIPYSEHEDFEDDVPFNMDRGEDTVVEGNFLPAPGKVS